MSDTEKDSTVIQGLYELYDEALNANNFLKANLIREEIRKVLTKEGPFLKIESELNLENPFPLSSEEEE